MQLNLGLGQQNGAASLADPRLHGSADGQGAILWHLSYFWGQSRVLALWQRQALGFL